VTAKRVTPQVFKDWLTRMNLSEIRAAASLGVSKATVGDWVRGTSRTTGKPIKISRLVALACAALEAGIDFKEKP
jgi:DNA-binding transcriptional regulator YiaG